MSEFLDKPDTITLRGMVRRLKGVPKRKTVPGIFWDSVVDYTEWESYEVGQDFVFNPDLVWFNKKYIREFEVHSFKITGYDDMKKFLVLMGIKEDVGSFYLQDYRGSYYISKIYVLNLKFDRARDTRYVFLDKRDLKQYIMNMFGVSTNRGPYRPH
jgi:hypothetical protein